MVERVEPYELHDAAALGWDPNAPEAFLLCDDFGRAALAQRAHPDDPDRRCVVLRWDKVRYAVMSPPNDEARNWHRLYEAGLKGLQWLGVVRDSQLAAAMAPMRSAASPFAPLHYIVVSKECVVEVLADDVEALRISGSPREAALANLLG